MSEKITLAPAGTTVDNIVVFDGTTGQIKDSGVPITSSMGGKILQVVSTEKTDTASYSSTTWANITGLTVSITPGDTANKVLVIVKCMTASNADGNSNFFRIARGGTAINVGDAASNRIQATAGGIDGQGQDGAECVSIAYLDSPATAASTTYSLQWRTDGTIYVNRGRLDTDVVDFSRATSTITVLELEG